MNAAQWTQVRATFDAVLDLPLAERDACITKLAGTDAEAARWVQTLIDGNVDASAQLERFDALRAPHQRNIAPSASDPLDLAGQVVSHFRVVELIGVGGMGVVYRAEDLRLRRSVALKFLHPEHGADAVARARFLVEAQSAATLEHPNICAVYEVGESEGRAFMAMPCYPGESLKRRLEKERPLAATEVIAIAVQVARGLAAAHAWGIVHRDLKPANLMIGPDGTVRILDFGLAKVRDLALSDSGVCLGTPRYMSPEQFRGDAVDARTDLWSLGVVLFEMLHGAPPADDHAHGSVAAPNGLATGAGATRVPEPLVRIVDRLLQRTLVKRYSSAEDLLRDLISLPQGVAAPAPSTGHRERVLAYSVIPVAILMTGAVLWGWLRPGPPEPVVRFTLVVDSTQEIAPAVSDIGRMALSPDGSMLAYVGRSRGELLVRRFPYLRATTIPDADGTTTPFFSPDGRQVGFLRDRMVRIASLSGGSPIDVSDTLTGQAGASWGSDGFIYVDGADWAGLFRVEPKAGAVPQSFTVLDTANGETDHTWPDVLPNGRGLLFTVTFGGKASKDRPAHAIAVADIPSGRHRLIVRDATFARYAKSGHLLYVTTNKTLMVAPFDQKTMKVTGPPTAVAEGMRLGLRGSADLAVSASGTLVYATGRGQLKEDLVWVTRAGKVTTIDSTWSGNVIVSPAISPNGKWVAVSRRVSDEFISIWIKQLEGGGSIRLPPEGGYDVDPSWTPDGTLLTYASVGLPGAFGLWMRRADGSGAPPVLEFRQKMSVFSPHWSPDGKWLVFQSDKRTAGRGHILGFRPGIDTVPVALVAGAATEASPALSPDGRWLAYDSNETGDFEIYVVPFPNTDAAKWAISSGGGTEPQWSHKGNELFYRDKAGSLTAVTLTTTPRFSVGRRTALFPAAAFESYPFDAQYAVGIDDKRFLMIRQFDANVPDRLVVVEHWFQELNGKAQLQSARR